MCAVVEQESYAALVSSICCTPKCGHSKFTVRDFVDIGAMSEENASALKTGIPQGKYQCCSL
jgi:hypothetical protein